MKLNFDLRVISIVLVICCGSIVFMWTATEAPLAKSAATAAQATPTPTPCSSPNPVSKFASNPAVIQVDTTNDIFAVGDAHADPGRLAGGLVKAGIIGGGT